MKPAQSIEKILETNMGGGGGLWSPAANTECYIILKTTDSLPSDSGHKTCQCCAVFMIIRHQLSFIPCLFG